MLCLNSRLLCCCTPSHTNVPAMSKECSGALPTPICPATPPPAHHQLTQQASLTLPSPATVTTCPWEGVQSEAFLSLLLHSQRSPACSPNSAPSCRSPNERAAVVPEVCTTALRTCSSLEWQQRHRGERAREAWQHRTCGHGLNSEENASTSPHNPPHSLLLAHILVLGP